MSELLDELARALAKPIPRSRAMRLLGGALVTAAVPLLRAAPGAGASTQPDQYPAPKKCADYKEGPTCPKLCCRDCPPIPSGGNPGVLRWCCNAGDECNFEDPSEQYRCGRVGCKPRGRDCRGPANRITSVKTPSGNDLGLTNSSLREGQKVTASEQMTLQFKNGTLVRLDKGASFQVDTCGDETDPTVLDLLLGKLWTATKSAVGAPPFQVETERAVTGPRGTTYWVSYLPGPKRTTVHVVKGSVELRQRFGARRRILVKGGQTAVQQGSGVPRLTKR